MGRFCAAWPLGDKCIGSSPYQKSDGTHVRGHWRRGTSRSATTPERTPRPNPTPPPPSLDAGWLVLTGFIILITFGAVAAFAISNVLSDSTVNNSSTNRRESAPARKSIPKKPATSVKDGGLQFLVKTAHLVGSSHSDDNGKLVVTVTVKNLTHQWVSFDGEDQFAISLEKKLSRGATLLVVLGPGETQVVTITFPIPPAFQVSHLEFHYMSRSKGVRVDIKT